MSNRARTTVRRLPAVLFGLVLFGFGMGLMVEADLGLSPWEALHQGISIHTPLTIGLAGILTGFVVLLAWIPLRQRPGLGTVLNIVVVGLVIDGTLALIETPASFVARLALMLGGIGIVALGSGIYIGRRLGPGPRDGLMTGLAGQARPLDSAGAVPHRGLGVGGRLAAGRNDRDRHSGLRRADRSAGPVLSRAPRRGQTVTDPAVSG